MLTLEFIHITIRGREYEYTKKLEIEYYEKSSLLVWWCYRKRPGKQPLVYNLYYIITDPYTWRGKSVYASEQPGLKFRINLSS